ncbi:MAG TPA: hypothetical protein VFE51_30715 [Verrucomicrobiae bacterium]|nr:hypothetical protein [Verrucomicrobiae bacterium]
MKFSLGQSQNERIEIDVLRYERLAVGEYYDDNWLSAQIRVRAGAFSGQVEAALLASELVAFLSSLEALHATLRGSAEFSTLEEQLHLVLVGDGRGHIALTGDIADQPGIGNRLHFALQFDQSGLAASIRELEKVTSQFPVRAV